jgi:hypothetical protein
MNHRDVLRTTDKWSNWGSRSPVSSTLPHRISVWLGARPCPRLSSDVRSSRTNDSPIGRGIPFDTAAFVLCSTRDLSGETKKLFKGRLHDGKVNDARALTLWIILVHPNGAFFVTRDDGQPLVGKEIVGGGHADLLCVLC